MYAAHFAKTYYILPKHSYLAKGFGKMDLVVALWNGEPTTKFHVFWLLCSNKKVCHGHYQNANPKP